MELGTKRRLNASATLLITFLLGVAIGFSAGYGVFGHGTPSPVFVPPPVAPPPDPIESEAAAQVPIAEPQPDLQTPSPSEPVSDTRTAASESVRNDSAPASPEAPIPEPSGVREIWPGRFLLIAIPGTTLDPKTGELLREVAPGGVVLREENMVDEQQTAALSLAIKQALGSPGKISDLPLVLVEQEGGTRNPMKLAAAPSARALANTGQHEAARAAGRAVGQAARARGIGVVLAPVLDVYGVGVGAPDFEERTFSTGQEEAAAFGLAFADGIQEGGALAVGKYFPNMAAARRSGPGGAYVLDGNSARLAEVMYPFNKASDHAIPGILAGYVAVPPLEPADPQRPACASSVMIGRIMREHWNYRGVVLSDDLAKHAQVPEQMAVEVLRAGCDAVLFLEARPERIRSAAAAIQKAIDDGTLAADALGASRKRIEEWQTLLDAYVPGESAGTEAPTQPIETGERSEPADAAPETAPDETPGPAGSPEAPPTVAPAPSAETQPVSELPAPDAASAPPASGPAPSTSTSTSTQEIPASGDAVESPPGEAEPAEATTAPEAAPELISKEADVAPPAPDSAETPKPEPAQPALPAAPAPANVEEIATEEYVVQPGDSANAIATRYGISLARFAALNGLADPNLIKLGQKLRVPRRP